MGTQAREVSAQYAIVADTETTGLFSGKKRSPLDLLHILEVGAVVIDTDFNVMDEFEVLVNPGEKILRHPQCDFVYRLTGLDAERLDAEGVEPGEAAVRFAEWSIKAEQDFGVKRITAFNNEFDFWFLDKPPWSFFRRTRLARGRCIMKAAMDIMGPAGVLQRPSVGLLMHKPDAKWKMPSAEEAEKYFRDLGYPIPSFGGGRHRALPDARVEGAIMVAIHKEEQKRA